MIITQKDLPERHENDEYITPKPFIRAVYERLATDIVDGFLEGRPIDLLSGDAVEVLDAGAGTGNWGNEFVKFFDWAIPDLNITGVELQDLPIPVGYDVWHNNTDFIEWSKKTKMAYDLSVGNPPYKYAHAFLDGLFRVVRENGLIILLLRNSFMESRARYERYFSVPFKRPWRIIQSVRRISFYYDQTGVKSTNATAYSVFVWKVGKSVMNTKLEWLDWDYD